MECNGVHSTGMCNSAGKRSTRGRCLLPKEGKVQVSCLHVCRTIKRARLAHA
jgi:hypothetical protein